MKSNFNDRYFRQVDGVAARYHFYFNGGINKPTRHVTEKFFLFFVSGGDEVPAHQMMSNGLVSGDGSSHYVTNLNVAKLHLSIQGFGIQKRYTSLYFRFLTGARPTVKIRPFGDAQSVFGFEGKVSFLKKSEYLALLKKDSNAYYWVKRSTMLAPNILREIVTVDTSYLRKGMRKIRIGNK